MTKIDAKRCYPANTDGSVRKNNSFRGSILFLFGVSLTLSPAFAQAQEFDIDAGPAVIALSEFAAQADVSVVYTYDVVDGLETNRVEGVYEPNQALNLLLAGTSLSAYEGDGGAFAISAREERGDSESKNLSQTPVMMAQNQMSSSRSQASTNESLVDDGDDKTSGSRELERIPEILVIGKRTLNVDIERTPDDIQPYAVFDQNDIAESGAQNIEDFLRTRLTSLNSPLTQQQTEGGTNRSGFDLRGLGQHQTLILVDGRRNVAVSELGSAMQPDLNGIPIAAIERIEVLANTASGVYGGGATGGVINVILRKDYAGISTKLTYGNSFEGGGGERRIDVSAGFNSKNNRTNILFAGSYSERTSLLVGERDFLTRGRQHILDNNPGSLLSGSPPLSGTTNIRSSSGANLTLRPELGGGDIGSAITYVPYLYAGPSADGGAGLVANGGQYNMDPANTVQSRGGAKQALLNAPTVKSAILTARQRLTENIDMFLELSASENASSFSTNGANSQFVIPAGAASNPFNEDVIVTTPAIGTDRASTSVSKSEKITTGAIIKLPKDWMAALDFMWNRTEFTRAQYAGSFTTAINSAINDGEIDVFKDTNEFPADFATYFQGDPVVAAPSDGTMKGFAVRVGGQLPWSLPGGSPSLSLLVEYRDEKLDDYVLTNPNFFLGPLSTTYYNRSQSISSVYAESLFPLVSSKNERPGVRLLEVSLAVRRDDYRITGASNNVISVPGILDPAPRIEEERDVSSVDPTLGIRYRPVESITFRANYATGFLPPQMTFLVPGRTVNSTVALRRGLTDPLRGNEPIGVIILTQGGNPDLRSEESTSRSVGFIANPHWLPGLRLSIDWLRISKRDNVTFLSPFQDTIDSEEFIPGIIVRGEPSDGYDVGPITGFNGAAINLARQEVEAVDYSVSYDRATAKRGTFGLLISATRSISNRSQLFPTSLESETSGLAGSLKWQGSAVLSWDHRSWGVAWGARFYDSYFKRSDHSVVENQGSAKIPSQTYHDLSISFQPGVVSHSAFLANSELRLGIKNVFNSKPPIDVESAFFYSTFGDPRLANYYLSVRKDF